MSVTIIKEFELVIKKSRFISKLYDISSSADIDKILEYEKKENKKATHICYAYKITKDGYHEKCYDDGEPSGTAGKPILNVINKQNMKDVMIVVIRHYGGIKLGAGGLIRAYSKSASELVKI